MALDINMAIMKHLNWKLRLQRFMAGEESLTLDQAISHRDCDLGKWMYSGGIEKYSSWPKIGTLESEHTSLHASVKEVISLRKATRHAEAAAELTKLESTSDRIVGLLKELQQAR